MCLEIFAPLRTKPHHAVALLLVLLAVPFPARAEAARPNFVFFLIDDQRNDTLGCAGHPIVQTPVVDSLAAEGVRFSNAFVTTSICAASRATLFTGLYERTHRYTFGTPPIRADHIAESLPVLLKNGGYRTAFFGKFGVQVEKGAEDEMFDVYKPLGPGHYFIDMPDGTKRHETDLAADWAIDFVEETPAETPFFVQVSFNAAHANDGDKENHYPWPPGVDGLYEDTVMPRPRLDDPAIFEAQPDFLKNSLNRERYFWRWDTPEKYQKNMRAYFRMLTGIDRAIGRVRDALEAQGRAGNTVIVYMGDNGYYMANRGFAGKWSHYEESLRVPLIVYDPRVPEGKRGTTPAAMALNVDVPPTILAAAGIAIPQGYQGESLLPFVNGETPKNWRTEFFCEHLMEHPKIPKWEGLRDTRYVYARYFEQDPPYEFLHDLETDPDELRNLAGDPAFAKILADLRGRCFVLRDAYAAARDDAPTTPR